LPALLQADEYQQRASRVGLDWPDLHGVLEKLQEQLAEVQTAEDENSRSHQIGDVLFAVVSLSRRYGVDPESALRQANARFRQRFASLEAAARLQGRTVADLPSDELRSLWRLSIP
jgi:uncharacterized protein YabN with tetrapyrrole methylase and pyrophosphatase domain